MKPNYYKFLILISLVTFSFSACKKDKEVDTDFAVSTEENAQADETFTDSFTDISSYSSENDASFSGTTMQSKSTGLNILSTVDQPNVTITGTVGKEWPKIVTFDYGTGITKGGITKKGKIQAVYSNRFKTKGSKIVVSFIDFYVNGHKIEGIKTITNNGLNAPGHYTFTAVVSKSRITNTGGSFTHDATHIFEWTKGVGTSTRTDDEFSITGSSTGTSSKGVAYTTTIIKPLIKRTAFPFIIAGSIDIKAGDILRTLDYGDGTLDGKAIIKYIGGPTVTIYLRK